MALKMATAAYNFSHRFCLHFSPLFKELFLLFIARRFCPYPQFPLALWCSAAALQVVVVTVAVVVIKFCEDSSNG